MYVYIYISRWLRRSITHGHTHTHTHTHTKEVLSVSG
jgi:hypothetical protein